MVCRVSPVSEKLCVVVNRYQSGDVVSAAEAVEVLKTEIFFKLPNDYKVSSEAATAGVPVGRSHEDSKLAWAYLQLGQKLSGGMAVEIESATNGTKSRIAKLFSRKRS